MECKFESTQSPSGKQIFALRQRNITPARQENGGAAFSSGKPAREVQSPRFVRLAAARRGNEQIENQQSRYASAVFRAAAHEKSRLRYGGPRAAGEAKPDEDSAANG